ncbi:MAG TPA: phosphotransferase [Candidatus Saccharimonadia bacterium]|nr:phosphotransferase [Candidatus Saccharimonadia bacterium]
MSLQPEVPLHGGALNANIARIGNTVHREQSKNAAFVHKLFLYLEKADFAEAPRFLGIDNKNREILTYFEGNVPPGSGVKLNDAKLENVAKLIRRYHDVTADSKLSSKSEIVAHGDLGPHNTVFQNDTPIGFIDWDEAAPGARLRDFAYAVDCYTDLINKNIDTMEQVRRVKLMCQAYGWQKPVELLRDIQTDYQKALTRHKSKHSTEATKIFEDLNSWLDIRIPEMISRLNEI